MYRLVEIIVVMIMTLFKCVAKAMHLNKVVMMFYCFIGKIKAICKEKHINNNIIAIKRAMLISIALALLLSPSIITFGQSIPREQDLRETNIVDARKYGLRANGVTDDKVALNAAWNAVAALPKGGILQLPKGTIYLATKWVPSDPGAGKSVWIRGSGQDVTIIKFNTTVANNSYFFSFEGTSVDHFSSVTISDITFDCSEWNDGTNRINTGTVVGTTGTSVTLGASASAVDNYYNNMFVCILEDTGNTDAQYQLKQISAYNGTTKQATVSAWGSGRTPTTSAKYAILLDGTDATDQLTRGVGRILFNFMDTCAVYRCKKIGGHGFLDFRGSVGIAVTHIKTEYVTENAINFLDKTGAAPDRVCSNVVVSECIIEAGEGIDCAADDITISNCAFNILGQDDEAIDGNTSHRMTVTNCIINGGQNAINLHGTVSGVSEDEACRDIRISNVVARQFYAYGFVCQFGAIDGTAQTAGNNGNYIRNISITNCSFISTKTGSIGMNPGWSNTTFPVYSNDVFISNCYAETDGDAISANLSKRLTVRDCRAKSTTGRGFVTFAATGTTAVDLRLFNVYATGAGTSTTTGGGIEIAQAQNVLIKNCRAETVTQGEAIRCLNVMKGIRIEDTEVIGAHHHGVEVQWNSATYIDSDLDLKFTFKNNVIKDWGSATSGRRGLYVYVNNNASTYTGITVVGNQFLLPVVANNGHYGGYLQTTGSVGNWRIQDNYITTAIATNANRWTTSATFVSPFISSGNNPPLSNIIAKTANYSVLFADSYSIFSNTGAAGTITFSLPTAILGMEFTFYVGAAQQLRVDPGANDKFQYTTLAGGITSMADGEYIVCSTTGGLLHIRCFDAAVGWVILNDSVGGVGGVGAWTEETL